MSVLTESSLRFNYLFSPYKVQLSLSKLPINRNTFAFIIVVFFGKDTSGERETQ